MNRTCTIYALSDPRLPQVFENVRYVGKTVYVLKKRLSEHICRKFDTYKRRWIGKLLSEGCEPAIWPLAFCSEEGWEEVEKWWIAKLKPIARLTNQSEGGDGGFFQTAEMREKIRAKKLGVKKPPMSQEQKDKIRARAIGRVMPREGVEKLRLALTGMKRSPEICKKFSDAQKARFAKARAEGKTFNHSEELKKKMSLAHMGIRVPESARIKIGIANSKPVMCIETGAVFPSAVAAAKSLGGNASTLISSAIKTGYAYKGHHWKKCERP